MSDEYLIATDLDRTLIANGLQPEPVGAMAGFKQLVANNPVKLAYVSGRHLALVEQAIADYGLPNPDFIIADVGSSVYAKTANGFSLLKGWQQRLTGEWLGFNSSDFAKHLGPLPALKLQDPEKQSTFKLSYQCRPAKAMAKDVELIRQALASEEIAAQIITSIDETQDQGLVDILPPSANKKNALDYLISQLNLSTRSVVFSGDSGNDREILLSSYPSILVGNATEEFRNELSANRPETLYFAKQYYSAGMVEGILAHFPFFNK